MTPKPSPEWMQAALDGELTADEQSQFERQLAESPEARARWLALLEVARILGAAPMATPRPGFGKRFQARLALRRTRSKVVGGALALALAAPVGMVVMAVLASGELLSALILARSPSQWALAQLTGLAMSLADARAVLSTLAASANALAGWALSHPLAWLAVALAGAVVAAWLYLIRKMTLEVSLS